MQRIFLYFILLYKLTIPVKGIIIYVRIQITSSSVKLVFLFLWLKSSWFKLY